MKETHLVIGCLLGLLFTGCDKVTLEEHRECMAEEMLCDENSTPQTDDLLMPGNASNEHGLTGQMEGWIQAQQLEQMDGIPRVPIRSVQGIKLLPYELDGEAILVGGDLQIGTTSALQSAKENGRAISSIRFPNGFVPWYAGLIPSHNLSIIQEAIDILMTHTPVRFEAVDQGFKGDAIEFRSDPTCNGRVIFADQEESQNRIRINICDDGQPISLESTMHQLGHALGLHHEFQRSDRQSHVSLCTPGDTALLTPITGIFWGNEPHALSPYDYKSIMNAGWRACIQPLHSNNDAHHEVGISEYPLLSRRDINKLYRIYGPSLLSAEEQQQFGINTVNGDFDGDGITDLAILTNEPESTPFNQINLVFMKGIEKDLNEDGLPLTFTPWFKETIGFTKNPELKPAIISADFNGDGIDDLAVGDPSFENGRGRVRVLIVNTPNRFGSRPVWGSGSIESGYWLFPEHFELQGDMEYQFGSSLDAGHITNTDCDDLIIGVPGGGKAAPGAWTGETGGIIIAPQGSHWNHLFIHPPQNSEEFGKKLTILPRICADSGLDGLAIASVESNSGHGQVHINPCADSTNDLSKIPSPSLSNGFQGESFAMTMAAFTVINKESSHVYLAVADSKAPVQGSEEVGFITLYAIHSDRAPEELTGFIPSSYNPQMYFGASVTTTSSVYHGEHEQVGLIIGAPGAQCGTSTCGKLYHWHPWKNGELYPSAFVIKGLESTTSSGFGSAVKSAQDPNGNNILIAGLPSAHIDTEKTDSAPEGEAGTPLTMTGAIEIFFERRAGQGFDTEQREFLHVGTSGLLGNTALTP